MEAEPEASVKIQRNLNLNGFENIIKVINCGLSDRSETLNLSVHTSGNRGGSSFLLSSPVSVPVQCRPLVDILMEQGVQRVHGMKIDIESMELEFYRLSLEMRQKISGRGS
ncbi:MAG: FkbM family methyltransferase [Spirochaetales bacterium]|nr:FkbM family methyltransferase [Spirochaetales bacterium]